SLSDSYPHVRLHPRTHHPPPRSALFPYTTLFRSSKALLRIDRRLGRGRPAGGIAAEDSPHDHEEQRHEEDTQQRARDGATEDPGTDLVLAALARPGFDLQLYHADGEGVRGHDVLPLSLPDRDDRHH